MFSVPENRDASISVHKGRIDPALISIVFYHLDRSRIRQLLAIVGCGDWQGWLGWVGWAGSVDRDLAVDLEIDFTLMSH